MKKMDKIYYGTWIAACLFVLGITLITGVGFVPAIISVIICTPIVIICWNAAKGIAGLYFDK